VRPPISRIINNSRIHLFSCQKLLFSCQKLIKRRIFSVIIEPRIFCIESRTFCGVYPVMCQCTLPSTHQRFIDFWFARYYDCCNGGDAELPYGWPVTQAPEVVGTWPLPTRRRSIRFTPERLQQIINLVERGKSREEIADILDVTVGSLQVTCSGWVSVSNDLRLAMEPACCGRERLLVKIRVITPVTTMD
jgi:hypothetical protein